MELYEEKLYKIILQGRREKITTEEIFTNIKKEYVFMTREQFQELRADINSIKRLIKDGKV